MYFQNYDYAVRSGAEKMYQALDHIQEILRFGRLSLRGGGGGGGYVVCFVSVYTISCCLQCRVLVILCLSTHYIIFFYL